ncbi:hypothetical protein HQ531_05580 [bacterium]|nr:hypothetical protein [bacterium]
MRKLLYLLFVMLLTMALFTVIACEEDDDDDPTVAENLVGVWLADSTIGDLGNAVTTGSLAGAGWISYQLTLNSNGTYSAEGANPFDQELYGGDGDGVIHYSGTYTIDDSQDPMWIDLTCTTSDLEVFFSTLAAVQPMQPGIFSLNADDDEMTLQWGAKAFEIPRPEAFIAAPGTLVKQ